jgi:hypothetical protein
VNVRQIVAFAFATLAGCGVNEHSLQESAKEGGLRVNWSAGEELRVAKCKFTLLWAEQEVPQLARLRVGAESLHNDEVVCRIRLGLIYEDNVIGEGTDSVILDPGQKQVFTVRVRSDSKRDQWVLAQASGYLPGMENQMNSVFDDELDAEKVVRIDVAAVEFTPMWLSNPYFPDEPEEKICEREAPRHVRECLEYRSISRAFGEGEL